VVVDAVFPDQLPAIYAACEDRDGRRRRQRTDRADLRGPASTSATIAFAPFAMDATDGLQRGDKCGRHRRPDHCSGRRRHPSGGSSTCSASRSTNGPELEAGEALADPPPGPEGSDLTPTQEILETGIKVIDLLAPTPKAGKVGLSAAPASARPC